MSAEQVEEVIKMRKDGYSLSDIGRYFGKDHTTILYHCQKAGIASTSSEPKKEKIAIVKRRLEPRPVLQPRIEEDDDEGPRNPGMNYEDYLAIEKKRKWNERKDMAPPRVDEETPYPQVDILEKEYNEPTND